MQPDHTAQRRQPAPSMRAQSRVQRRVDAVVPGRGDVDGQRVPGRTSKMSKQRAGQPSAQRERSAHGTRIREGLTAPPLRRDRHPDSRVIKRSKGWEPQLSRTSGGRRRRAAPSRWSARTAGRPRRTAAPAASGSRSGCPAAAWTARCCSSRSCAQPQSRHSIAGKHTAWHDTLSKRQCRSHGGARSLQRWVEASGEKHRSKTMSKPLHPLFSSFRKFGRRIFPSVNGRVPGCTAQRPPGGTGPQPPCIHQVISGSVTLTWTKWSASLWNDPGPSARAPVGLKHHGQGTSQCTVLKQQPFAAHCAAVIPAKAPGHVRRCATFFVMLAHWTGLGPGSSACCCRYRSAGTNCAPDPMATFQRDPGPKGERNRSRHGGGPATGTDGTACPCVPGRALGPAKAGTKASSAPRAITEAPRRPTDIGARILVVGPGELLAGDDRRASGFAMKWEGR